MLLLCQRLNIVLTWLGCCDRGYSIFLLEALTKAMKDSLTYHEEDSVLLSIFQRLQIQSLPIDRILVCLHRIYGLILLRDKYINYSWICIHSVGCFEIF